MAAGIAEFVFGTVAVYLAWQRTRSQESPVTRAVRWTGRTMVIAYPLLGVAYLTDRFGAFVEPIFFTCFSVMVLTELVETVRTTHVSRRLTTPAGLVRQSRTMLQRVSGG